jgi:hypothetical protein
MLQSILILASASAVLAAVPSHLANNIGFQPLIGKDSKSPFTGWQTFVSGSGAGTGLNTNLNGLQTTTEGYFAWEGGELKVLDPKYFPGYPTGTKFKNGYIATSKDVPAGSRVRLEYQWGGKLYEGGPTPDDSGILVWIQDQDRTWPQSIEVQIQKGRTGDFWILGDWPATPPQFESMLSEWKNSPDASTFERRFSSCIANATTTTITPKQREYWRQIRQRVLPGLSEAESYLPADNETGWNTVDTWMETDGSIVVLVNGVLVNHVKQATVDGKRINKGRFLIQAEGAWIRYRNIMVQSLTASNGNSTSGTGPILPPRNAVRLFDGTQSSLTKNWVRRVRKTQAADWTVTPTAGDMAGYFTVKPGSGNVWNDIQTATTVQNKFKQLDLHVEFQTPIVCQSVEEQKRGNSGIAVLGMYEMQILDSYNRPLSGKDDLGAIYGIADALVNAALPPGTWQRYDISIRPNVWYLGKKLANATITARLNGVLVQNATRVYGGVNSFTDTEGNNSARVPVVILQDHRNSGNSQVKFRNIWYTLTR